MAGDPTKWAPRPEANTTSHDGPRPIPSKLEIEKGPIDVDRRLSHSGPGANLQDFKLLASNTWRESNSWLTRERKYS